MKERIGDILQEQITLIATNDDIIEDLEFMLHSPEAKPTMDADLFFSRIVPIFWHELILNYSKLFDSKGDYSIIKLFHYFINDYRKIEWTNSITLKELKEMKEHICQPPISVTIGNIKALRDKVVAHLDKDRDKEDVQIHLSEIKKLNKWLLETYNKINDAWRGGHYLLGIEFLGKVEITIKNLNRLRDLE